jgi:hypothetical protein
MQRFLKRGKLKILIFFVSFNLFLISLKRLFCNNMYAETGQACKKGGVYKCFGHPGNTIKIETGDIFPKCTIDKSHDALWMRVPQPEQENKQTNGDLELSS